MPRTPRNVQPDGIYHVAPRGNDGRAIFLDDEDRWQLLGRLTEVALTRRWRVFGWCLMTNHFHMLVQVPGGDLSAGMQRLLSDYARYWNKEHGHGGHVFRNRFTSKAVLSDQHLLMTLRYIDLNPSRAGLVNDVTDWRWSSLRAHLGLGRAHGFHAADDSLRLMARDLGRGRATYSEFIQFDPSTAPAQGARFGKSWPQP